MTFRESSSHERRHPDPAIPQPDDGDTPTQRLDTGEVQEDLQEEKQKSKGLLIGLVAAGGLLLLAIVVIAFFLLNRGQGDPSSPARILRPQRQLTPTPGASETPSASPTPTTGTHRRDPPPPAGARRSRSIRSRCPRRPWICNTTHRCPCPTRSSRSRWSTANATHVVLRRRHTNDAESNGMGWDNLPTDGTSRRDFPGGMDFTFYCPSASQSYTITAKDDSGHKVSKTVTTNNGRSDQRGRARISRLVRRHRREARTRDRSSDRWPRGRRKIS